MGLFKRLNLTNDEMTRFIDQVNEAQTVKKIKAIASNAKIQSDANDAEQTLQSAKDKAIAYLKTLNLTEDELNAYTLAVQSATSIKEIDTIKTNATNHSDKNNEVQELKNAKETAIKQIQALDLNNTQYFVDQVNEAASIQKVNTIVGNAKQAEKNQKEQAEAEKLAKAKQDALSELKGFNLKAQKEHFTNLINNAKSSDEITQILADAKKVSDKNNEPKETVSIYFNFYDQNRKLILSKTLEMEYGDYSFTLDDFGLGHAKHLTGNLSGTITADSVGFSIRIQLPSISDSQEERDIMYEEFYKLLNEHRSKNGLYPLKTHSILQTGAILRAEEISEVFSHTRPNGYKYITVIREIAPGTTYSGMGENIAGGGFASFSGKDVAERILQMWIDSPGHNRNLLTSHYQEVGVGFYIKGSNVYAAFLISTIN